MKIEKRKLSDITPYFNNARENADAIAPTKASIAKYGFIKPIIVDKAGVIIAGHTRYIAAFQQGLEEVPVLVSDLDEEQAKMYRIADNKLAEKSYFNETALVDELKRMKMPQEMQDFFFEDLSQMLNFDVDFSSPTSEQFNYTIISDAEPAGTSTSTEDTQVEEAQDEAQQTPQETRMELYKPFFEDGVQKMRIVCPYCENVEVIEL